MMMMIIADHQADSSGPGLSEEGIISGRILLQWLELGYGVTYLNLGIALKF